MGKDKKSTEALKNNLQKIIITLICLLYVAQGIFSIVKKDGTVLEILGDISLSIIVGVALSINFNSMGLKDGRNSELFQSSIATYGEAKVKATKYFDKLPNWCDFKNEQELEFAKKNIILEAGLNWKAYKYGYYKNKEVFNNKLDDKQKKEVLKADKLKIPKLTTQELLSDLPHIKSKNKFGRDINEYVSKNIASELFNKVFMSIICGLFGLEPIITGSNAAEIIAGILWNAFQIAIWIIFGVFKYNNSKSFIEDEYRQTHIISKTEYLNEFIITIENNVDFLTLKEEAYVDKEIKKFIEEKENEYKQEKIKPDNNKMMLLKEGEI